MQMTTYVSCWRRPFNKSNRKNHKITMGHSRVREATKPNAETRDPPSQDPRDHRGQPSWHDSHPDTLKQTPTTPGRNKVVRKLPQWNRRVKHDLRWKRRRGYSTQSTLRVRSELLFQSSCCIKVWEGHHCASALAMRLHGMGDCTHHLCVVISVHWVLLMMCWLPWLYGVAAVWLSVPGLLRNWQI